MHKDVERILYDNEQVRARIREMGAQITRDYNGEPVVVIGILKGVAYFMTELTMDMDLPVQIDFMKASSYGSGTVSSGQPRILLDIGTDIRGKNVLLLDDILDTGITLRELRAMLLDREPKSLRLAVLLEKEGTNKTAMKADYVGFTVPNYFIVGWGLDYDEKYRNLDYIGILKPEVYQK